MDNKLKPIRKRLDLTLEEAANMLPFSKETLSRCETGDTELTIPRVEIIAEAYGVSPWEILGADVSDATEVIGCVQAGEWREAEQYEDARSISLHVPPAWTGLNRFALDVVGNSMDMVYPEGSIVLCVPVAAFSKGWEPNNGAHVVIERTDKGGAKEITLKEYTKTNGGVWLVPKSTHPEHQAPLELTNGSTVEVSIKALVIGGHVSYAGAQPGLST